MDMVIRRFIDVEGWEKDEEFSHYPEGSRPKMAFFPPIDQTPSYIKPVRRYLFKYSRKRYQDQFWAEVVAYHIGCLMRVDVPPAYPAFNSRTGECATLIEWFYEDSVATFFLGGHFMQLLIKDFDRHKGKQHNFRSIHTIFRALAAHASQKNEFEMTNWRSDLAKMILFDALCGNTDRHQDNWGILVDLSVMPPVVKLSPCYDNGTSLGHELSNEHHGVWDDGRLLRYVLRGTHHMKWEEGSSAREGHVSLVRKMLQDFPKQKEVLFSLLSEFDMEKFRKILNLLQEVPIPIKFDPWRAELIYRLVDLRRRLLIKELQ